MNLPSIHSIPEICFRHGLENIVVSPGSRCAPITIAFARHQNFSVKTISDERSAAFIALGMALASRKASVLVCTSGTAAANYLPAVIESWYQQVPLLILTADRPPEWIDQNDGQSIRQENLYGNHCKKSFQYPVDTSHPDAKWHAQRIINEAIELAHAFPAGPVHVNIPIREPFYPEGELTYDPIFPVRKSIEGIPTLSDNQQEQLHRELSTFKKILIVSGQSYADSSLEKELTQLIKNGFPVIADVLSNLHDRTFVHHCDICLLKPQAIAELEPDLLITFGKTILSKSLKQFMRNTKSLHHWHVQQSGEIADPFKKLTRVIRTSPELFANILNKTSRASTTYSNQWNKAETSARTHTRAYHEGAADWSEIAAFSLLEKHIPKNSFVHLSNSMAIRYASYLGWGQHSWDLHCNRGTSGIDGSMSTALGHALKTDRPVYFITGDLSFFYDRNALWNNYLPDNLKVIVLNNHGGGIFNMIDGPAKQPEAKTYFITQQSLSIENTVRDTGKNYFQAKSIESMKSQMKAFIETKALAFWELEFSIEESTNAFKKFKK